MQGIDITDTFQEVLVASHEVIAQKKKLREVTNSSVTIIEEKLSVLFKKVKGKTDSTETSFNDIIRLATSYCNMGIVYKDVTSKNKLVVARSHLKKCLELLSGKEMDPRAILLIMRAVVQLEHVFRQLNVAEKSCSFSHKAIGFYLEYTSQGSEFPAPIVSRLSVSLDIEELRSNTMLSLVMLYSELLPHIKECERDKWDPETLVKPIHNFFMNQWSDALTSPIEACAWAYATIDFSNYFTRHFRFPDALNYLAAIKYILDAYEDYTCKYFSAIMSFGDFLLLEGHYLTVWGLYYKNLLFFSKYNFSYSKYVKGRRANKSKSKPSIGSVSSTTLLFTNLEEHVKDIVSSIPVHISKLDDALTIYDYCVKYYNMAKNYFVAKDYESQFVIISSNEIDAGKYLTAYFVADKDTQLQHYKQRIRILTDMKNLITSEQLNSYTMFFIQYNFELIRIYGIVLDMVLKDAEVTEKRFEDIDTEVRTYVKNSVEYIKMYVEMLDKLVLLGKKE
ncbi:hypothetical protein X777_10772 [Ooceraea biroi]|uniref:Uncharacterized protein n=1 Tax=Ooceraea biroi TaxID=2015173 RepID=A0A026W3U1_OOCBI|nr:hypothetical protein X777_10772 [Ooceraea biroi]